MMPRREELLGEMGIRPLWRLRTAADEENSGEAAARGDEVADPAAKSLPSGMATVREETGCRVPDSANTAPAFLPAEADAAWTQLAAEVAACRACSLCEHRNQTVLGVGDRRPQWLFIGEGPGAEEDARGEPFVGQAGKLLDAMLAALGLRRGEGVYIANAVKCRPPGNRTPEAAEMAACRPFLERQIALLQPRIVVLLGRAAVHSVLGEERALAALRRKHFERYGVPVVVTYHPAYLLRNLADKAKAWEDLCFARRQLRGEGDALF
jgi:uracil-DNA glycosylase